MINSWLKNKSIVYKTWLLIALGLISIASIFLIARHDILNTMMVIELDEHGNELRQKSARVTAAIQSLVDDVRYLSISTPTTELTRQLNSPTENFEMLRQQIANEFIAILKSKRRFHQLRIFATADGGKEIVRVSRNPDGTISTAKKSELLKSEADPYFKAISHLQPGDTYLSPIKLNRENGKVETPHRPIIHAVMPLQNANGKTTGIIVCNMDFKEILDWLIGSHNDTFDYITNVNGDYLGHPNKAKTFGFEFNTPYRFQNDHPEMAELINNRSLGTEGKTFEHLNGDFGSAAIRTRFDPHTTANDILMIRLIPYETIAAQAASTISQTMWLILLLFLFGAVLAHWFTQMLVTPIRMLAKAADKIATGESRKLPDFDFGGEIGDLANDFNTMLEKLNLQQSELADSVKWNTLIMNTAPDAIITIDKKGSIHSFNLAAETTFGYKANEIRGKNISVLMPKSYAQHHNSHLDHYMKTGKTAVMGMNRELEGKRKDGSVFPMEIRVTEARFENKLRFVGILRDITRQKQDKETLKQSEARYREVVETSPYPIVVHNQEKFIYANRAALKFLGTDDPEVVLGKEFTRFIHPDYHKRAAEKLRKLLHNEPDDDEREYIAFRLNGEEAKIRLTSIMVEFDGKPAVLTQFRDITEEERAKEELHREHNLNQQLLLAIPSILIGVDHDGLVALWNQSAAVTFGIDKADALGTHFSELKIQWSWNTINHGIAESRAAGTSRIDDVTFQRPDGSEGILGLTIRTIYDDGIDNGFLLLGSDISERLKLEGQLQLAQKMEAVGELAAGIAHEINTPLQYVGDNIRFLKDAFSDMHELCEHYHKLIDHCEESSFAPEMIEILKKADEEADIEFIMEEIPSAIEQSLDGVSKASNIVSAMKEFSHPGQKEKTLGDINRILESTATVARNEWKYVAELKLELDENLPPIRCLPEINQVFLNMIVNAAHAIEEKLGENSSEQGLITITTSQTETHAVIRISDTGNGIPEENLNKIFEPFFTTKEVGKGTGQGLAISHNIIVEQHHGSLEIESKVGEGTTFIIRLPMLYNGEEA
ncbi:MAG: PAS domain S-box protein [Mariprofundaceae bacterium]